MFWHHGKTKFYDAPDFLEWCYKQANRYFPNNQIAVNESTEEVWGQVCRPNAMYYSYVENLILKGAKIDAIGMQFHAFGGVEKADMIFNPVRAFDIFDMYSRFGLPIHLSEVSIPSYGNDEEGEETQKELCRRMFSLWFSRKNIEAIIWWNFVDGTAYGDENKYHAGLLRNDMSEKPAFKAIKELIGKEWHTELCGETDSDGKISFCGFYGDYDVTVTDGIVTGDNLPVWTVEPTSNGVALSAGGSYLGYTSGTNFASATSAYEWGVAPGSNGGFVFDSTSTNRGIYYQLSGNRFGAYSTTNASNSGYVSELLVFKYAERTDEPSEPAVQDYYLVGYINGADYGCEADWENLGRYKFVGGKLTATFETDSYVFIKTGDNANWYLFESFCQDTTGTLIKDKSEKMFVPRGVELTFTLVENADGTLTRSYARPNSRT
jgi:hypothetical protein